MEKSRRRGEHQIGTIAKIKRGKAPVPAIAMRRLGKLAGDVTLLRSEMPMGIARLATFLVSDAIKAGKLRAILERYSAPGPEVWAGYLARPHLSTRTHAFFDFLTIEVPRNVLAASGAKRLGNRG
mgnify:CR=1 FL=1